MIELVSQSTTRLRRIMQTFLADERGSVMVEYALLSSITTATSYGASMMMADSTKQLFDKTQLAIEHAIAS